MQDRVSRYPGRVKLVPVDGRENVYDMTLADEPTTEGTKLNKATLLSDATAALFGLGADAVPDDVLEKARELITTAQTTANTANATAISKAAITYGRYTGKGTHGSANKNSLNFTSTPRLLVIRSKITSGTQNSGATFIYPCTAVPLDIGSESVTLTTSWGTTVSWYHEINASLQLNTSGVTYYYAALL